MMTNTKTTTYRIKLVDTHGNVSYVQRKTNGRVRLFTDQLVPLALSNLAGNKAAELRLKLENAANATEAMRSISELSVGKRILTIT